MNIVWVRNRVLIAVIVCCSSLQGFTQTPELYINEFLASNTSSNTNPVNGEFSDWIEIYNAGSVGVDLNGLYLTDDPTEPAKWKIPLDSIIPPGGYTVFWADDLDRTNHTNFKLGRSGEFIGLYDRELNVIDSITFGYQEDDISHGRITGNLLSWAYFDTVTPGEPNPDTYYAGRSGDPEFSVPGGFYSGGQTVGISSPGTIYYTLDGSPPDTSDMIYTSAITIDSTTALRARVYENGKLPGTIVTQTYFINEEINLPMISLSTDPKNLFDDSLGIYVIGTNGVPGYCTDKPMNVNRDWERPVNIELYDENGKVELNQRAGIKIFGGCSRTRYPQKGLALFARGVYGKGSFDLQLFKDKPISTFESFILRNSGDDVVYTMLKDPIGQTIVKDMDIDKQAYRPSVVFINGQYWGIHNIREKINEHYPAGNYNIDADEINIIKGDPTKSYNVMSGSADHYNRLINNISRLNMNDESFYQRIGTRMDIDNYIDYQIAEIYLSANDWPMNNIKYWRADSGPWDKWRWIIYDLDNCFIYIERNTLELATDPWCGCNWPNPPWSTLLFRKMLENENFRNDFIQRYAWHMNTTFQPDRIYSIIDSLKANIEPEVPRHIERWGGQLVPDPESWIQPTFNSMEEWEGNIDRMKNFVAKRRPFATGHVIEYFDLPNAMAEISVTSDQPDAGIIKIAGQTLGGANHTGDYFLDVPLTIKAISSLGYDFSHWEYSTPGEGTKQIKEQVLTLTLTGDVTLVAHFTQSDGYDPALVINEINYHSSDDFDPEDWVEIYNMKNEIVDLSGWTIKDGNDDHIFMFPSGYEIGPNGYLVICEDIASFSEFHPEVQNRIGDLGYGLNNGGELIRLYGPDGSLIDYVDYGDTSPWPSEADGMGATLELTDPALDNNLPESWEASHEHGTPGRQNFSNRIAENHIYQNYPNPTNSMTYISFSMAAPGQVTIQVYDAYGRKVTTLVDAEKEVSTHTVAWDAGAMPNGIYFYTFMVDGQLVDTKRMVVLR